MKESDLNYIRYTNYLHSKAAVTGTPLSGTYELTARCNLDCRMCYIHRRPFDGTALKGEKPAAWWNQLTDTLHDAGMLTLLLTGGEPFLRPDFLEIYNHAHDKGILVSINSNGSMVTETLMAALRARQPQRVNITLYGTSRETYRRLCGDPDAYDRTLRTIFAMRDAGIPLKLNYSVTPENQQDAQAALDFCQKNDLVIDFATYLFPPIRACEHGSYETTRISPQESAEIQLMFDKHRYPPETYAQRRRDILSGNYIPDGTEQCMDQPTEHIRCRAGKTCFWVTWEGQLRPCGMMSTPSVSMEQGFSPAWEQIKALREEIVVPAKCTACSMRNVCTACPAASFSETGHYAGVPEYLCQKATAYLELLSREEESERT